MKRMLDSVFISLNRFWWSSDDGPKTGLDGKNLNWSKRLKKAHIAKVQCARFNNNAYLLLALLSDNGFCENIKKPP